MGLFGVLPFLLVSCITFLLILIRRRDATKGKLPPGPTPLPLLGNLLQLNIRDIVTSFKKVSEQYGPVFTVYMGSRPIVVLCGYEVIKEALVDNAETFGGRGHIQSLDDSLSKYGVVPTNGERWKQLRRFSLITLRSFGMGKRSIEERIQEEAQFLVQVLRKTEGHPFDPTIHLSHAVSNVICSIVFGNRFEYEDKDFIYLLDTIKKASSVMMSTWLQEERKSVSWSMPSAASAYIFRRVGLDGAARPFSSQICNFFPSLMRILPGPQHKMPRYMKKLTNFISQRVKMHQESFDPNCPRDFIDCFLAKMEQEKRNPASEFIHENLVATVHNLFFAGTDTTGNTIMQGLLVLLRYPEMEAKIQEEIERVIGRNRSPSYEDRNQMPYTEAFINENQRFLDLSPVAAPHSVTQEAHFRGFTIPKGTTVIPLLSSIMKSSQHYETPRKFNPGHFLDETGAFKKVDAFLPFGAGKRACPGEGLARMEIFVFLTTLLQNFHLKRFEKQEEIDIAPEVKSNGHAPRHYQLCVVPR
ncbi:cytochrome P450 2C29-like [Lacerta agilis]|uniref:cytochrome P450 2C29-like n=1 Tax=Lacerta agilis TaxID=80427 RepID=UPI001419A245|nr:cytochrome P450 2C29-like [Lacerta agilis]